MGTKSYADKVLTSEAILKVVQHTYNMEMHKIVTNDTEIQIVAIQDSLGRFDNVKDPQANNFLEHGNTEDDKELSEVGSYISHQACVKARKLASSLKSPT
eukprot:3561125-Ditylum_brightwellii.AAC.1